MDYGILCWAYGQVKNEVIANMKLRLSLLQYEMSVYAHLKKKKNGCVWHWKKKLYLGKYKETYKSDEKNLVQKKKKIFSNSS